MRREPKGRELTDASVEWLFLPRSQQHLYAEIHSEANGMGVIGGEAFVLCGLMRYCF